MNQADIALGRKHNPYFRTDYGEMLRKRNYPDSLPSNRPVIDMTEPCWWVERSEERALAATVLRLSLSLQHSYSQVGSAHHEWRWCGHDIHGENEQRYRLSCFRRNCRFNDLNDAQAILCAHRDWYGSVIDNGSVRTVAWPNVGERYADYCI